MKKSLLSVAFIGALAIGFSGCGAGSQPNLKNNKTAKSIITQNSMFVKLELHNGKWKAVQIQENSIPMNHSKGILGLGITKSGNVWLSGWSKIRHGNKVMCSKKNRNSYKIYCKEDTPFFSDSIGMRFKPYGGIKFNQNKIYEFIEDNSLEKDINIYDQILSYSKQKHNETQNYIDSKLSSIISNLEKGKNSYNTSKPNIKLVVNDNSGLYDNSIDFNSMISYSHNEIKFPKYNLEAIAISYSLSNKVDKKSFLTKIDNYYKEKTSEFNTKLPDLKERAKSNLYFNSKYVQATYNIKDSSVFNYSIKKIDKFSLDKVNTIVIDIKSANIKLKYPIINIGDKTLEIKNGLQFHNLTDSFISLQSASYYLNNDIKTDKKMNMEIAPQSYSKINDYFVNHTFGSKLVFNNTTAEQLKKTKINYGVALKYSTSDNTKTKTLYKTETKSAYKLYKQQ